MLYPLEPRRHLSTASLSSRGTLLVIGDNRSERIAVVRADAMHYSVTIGFTTQQGDESTATFGPFLASAVKRISVLAGGGNDRARVKVPRPASLYGGDGKDLLVAGGRAAYMEGGIGDDTLVGGAGNDTMIGSTADSDLSEVTRDYSDWGGLQRQYVGIELAA